MVEESPNITRDISSDDFFSDLCTHTGQVRGVFTQIQAQKRGSGIATRLWLESENYEKQAERLKNCGTTWTLLKCLEEHAKYVRLRCGFDFCPICGQKGSAEHKRRYTRALDRLINLGPLKELVLTLPEEVSASRPDRDTIKLLYRKAESIVKKYFNATGGMMRTHFLGDKGDKLHVHINVLFPAEEKDEKSMVPQETLTQARDEWTNYINKKFSLNIEKCNLFYKFAPETGKRIHRIKYILRPIVTTMKFLILSDEDKHYIMSFQGWHNTRWFGNLANCKYKKYLKSKGIELDKEGNKDASLSKLCPVCGGKFRFVGIFHTDELPHDQLRYVNDDVFVDLEVWEALKAQNKWKIFDSDLSFKDIVKQYS